MFKGNTQLDVKKDKDFRIYLEINNTNTEWTEDVCYQCKNEYGPFVSFNHMVVGYKISPNPVPPKCNGYLSKTFLPAPG